MIYHGDGGAGVGGLVGMSTGGIIENCYVTGNVSGDYRVGGLVGWIDGGIIENSYATGNVNGNDYVGGLVGHHQNGTITNSYASGTLSGNYGVGGLAGDNESGIIENSYATGNVNGDERVGGLAGDNDSQITNSYATGNVNGDERVGGLVGYNASTITNSYATGTVSGTSEIGGLVGYKESGIITNSFWDVETSGQSSSDGGTGLTTTEMKTISNFIDAGWDFTDIWQLYEYVNDGYPSLQWQGTDTSIFDEDIIMVSDKAKLYPAYPNPFNPTTTISFDIKEKTNVSIEIFNIKGQRVKQLVNREVAPGHHIVVWNGTDDNNRIVSSGVYFYKMQADEYFKINKIIMMK